MRLTRTKGEKTMRALNLNSHELFKSGRLERYPIAFANRTTVNGKVYATPLEGCGLWVLNNETKWFDQIVSTSDFSIENESIEEFLEKNPSLKNV